MKDELEPERMKSIWQKYSASFLDNFGIYLIRYYLWTQWFLSTMIRNRLYIIRYCLLLIWDLYYGCNCWRSTCLYLIRFWWYRRIVCFWSYRIIIIITEVFRTIDRFLKRSDWCNCRNRSWFFHLFIKENIIWLSIDTHRWTTMINFTLIFLNTCYMHC